MDKKNVWIAHGTEREDADINLLLFTYAGGSPSMFAPWKKEMPGHINMCPVLYPERELRKNELLPETVEEMARNFIEESLDLFEKDFVLFGHCTGNILAIVVADILKNKYGKKPVCVIASGSESPKMSETGLLAYDTEGNAITNEALVDKMIEFGLVPATFKGNKNFIDYYIPTYRKDLIQMAKYKFKAGSEYDCPIYVVNGDNDPTVRQEGIDNWKEMTSGEVIFETFPGGHFYLNDMKKLMTRKISDFIDSCR